MLSGRAQWERNLAALREVSRPIVVELLGHGRSPSPEDPASYHPDAYVEVFESIRGVSRRGVLGALWPILGATLTLRYALRYPERVCAQVFTNSTSALADPEQEERVGRQIEGVVREVEAQGEAGLEGLGFHPRHARSLPPDIHALLIREAKALSPQGVVRTLLHTVPEASLYREIHRNRVPTLLVVGERERRFARVREYAEREMPRLESVGFAAGHAVNIEASEEFDRAVSAFLRRHCEAASAR